MAKLIVGSAVLLAACAPASITSSRQPLRATSGILYYHTTIAAGPAVLTRDDGSILDERRHEPFGAAIDGDDAKDPHNALNKETDPLTGWSDHGARWLAPETASWLTPDPPVKAPDPKLLSEPARLHPYQFVLQNPVQFWDPDGKDAYHIEWKEHHAILAAQAQERLAIAVAAIGGARPGITPAPARDIPAAKIVATLAWNSKLTETKAAALHPWVAWRKLDPLQDEAKVMSEHWGLMVLRTRENHNNAVDAFRHAYFSYRLTQIENAAVAQRWGDAHEVSVPSWAAERAMDLWNNAVGRQLATERGDAEAYWVIDQAYRRGLLMTEPGAGDAAPEPRPYELPVARDYLPHGKFR